MAVVLHDDPFRFQQKTLFRPAGHKSPRMIDDSVARIFAIVFRHSKNLSHQSGILVPSDQTCDLAICGDAPFRYFLNDGKDFIYQIVIEDTASRTATPFP